MARNAYMPKSRIEAFSDGVIAIIITIMVFELKVTANFSRETFREEFQLLLPKFISYAASFTMLAVLWINHHHLFHHIRQADNRLTWLNMNLLFWMSLIPFGTGFIGANYKLEIASCLYGIIFFMTALAFKLLREYAENKGLMANPIHPELLRKSRVKSKFTLLMYGLASVSGFARPWLAFLFMLAVPLMYLIPAASTESKE